MLAAGSHSACMFCCLACHTIQPHHRLKRIDGYFYSLFKAMGNNIRNIYNAREAVVDLRTAAFVLAIEKIADSYKSMEL